MKISRLAAVLATALWAPGLAWSYPGGTPSYQTDVAPFCAGCHSSRNVEMLEGAGERAQKELSERKHISLILAGQKGYASLSEADRKSLADQIRALDEASTVTLTAPERVETGATFQVTVSVTGGAGPVVAVGLVDRAHRWYARPATSAGWSVAGEPQITGPDGQVQRGWLDKRPADAGRNLAFVNVKGIASDAAAKNWAAAQVVFTLRAPDRPGSYPLGASYLYGTEKSTVLGYTTNPLGRKEVRGGLGGGSGRVLFTDIAAIEVTPPAAPAAAAPAAPVAPPPPVQPTTP